LDDTGKVIGMATLVYREWQNLNFAISAERIKSYLLCERNKAQAQATPSPTLRQTRPETQEALGG
jgi:hypothetical protein